MSEEKLTNNTVEVHNSGTSSDKHQPEEESHYTGPLRWYDKKIVSFLPAYSESMVQIVMLAFTCFMLPGMYNALSGVGGAGISLSVSNNSSVSLYSTFCGYGFFAGWVCNIIGTKFSLMFGGVGYVIYSGSLLYYTKHSFTNADGVVEDYGGAAAFVVAAGAILGVCAGQLWAAQTSIIISYPAEHLKGKAIMTFWVIFNLGAVIGSAISLGNNMKNNSSVATDGTYAAFIALMCSGIIIAGCTLRPHQVWRGGVGSERVVQQQFPHWKVELINMAKMLYKEPKIYFLFPMFFASNWFYTYQFNDVNAARFTIRTRSLNSLLYWAAQMVGAAIFGNILDWKRFDRKTRVKIGWSIIMVLTFVIWGGGYDFQKKYTRESVAGMALIDFKKGSTYVGPMFLYIFYGMYDAMFQTFIYYTLGAMSNNPKKNAIYGAFFKSIQSAGAAIMWRLDYYEVPYMSMFASSWGLCAGALVLASPLIFFKISNHTEDAEDDLQGELLNRGLEISKSISQPEPKNPEV
ncbi:hypothetical protein PSN45_004572 [Yamadazyma tenuis]|uniref:MFS general substrate transporter n=1 Tax=Candida tenuis (strain ATCC 10573 / BCRC 21748 / CBS 615 / JCM 9827 / NBRC 10315 / NRRL Y-1498 / VKM Y-70) TaxID=590646 RepID=G3B577_CANTC|nr:uncharacterized protein CANTEDRAFT_114476 [Yamadazyma tenuis ATCC 10573]XP_006687354.1 uncharacterized protein CANTEDRAFT_114476 [Yamadazyma tenuis ATCC 10573]EGV63560.1 hypothetical protein CANTEDRAFT_114476 [Yamadazyma tenuis ATCC 10573]EGV63561.1 hypothetical protein CANTEDRAFT_114476 [Yamadazyma tenuis ATCC 10573]WEJ97025.1 hypothetical protein PSN45_004572 [Yamadazyma tenuis]